MPPQRILRVNLVNFHRVLWRSSARADILSAPLRCSQQFSLASIHHRLLDPFPFLLTGFAFLPSKVATTINPDEPDVHKGTRLAINRFYRRANYWAGTSMANCEPAA